MSQVIAVRFEPYMKGPHHIHVYVQVMEKGNKKPDVKKFQAKGICIIAEGEREKKVEICSSLYPSCILWP